MNKKIIWAIIAVVVLAGIYYAVTYAPTTPTKVLETPVVNQQQPVAAGPVLKLGTDAKLGTYITAENGLTLYAFAKDTAGVSNCLGACATLWPPYIVPAAGTHAAVPTITGALGTLQRADGTVQLTYKGAPLYFWSKDTKAGDTTGNGFNNLWSIVHP